MEEIERVLCQNCGEEVFVNASNKFLICIDKKIHVSVDVLGCHHPITQLTGSLADLEMVLREDEIDELYVLAPPPELNFVTFPDEPSFVECPWCKQSVLSPHGDWKVEKCEEGKHVLFLVNITRVTVE
jgi:hypothetical protein